MKHIVLAPIAVMLVACVATSDNPRPKASEKDAAIYNTQLGLQYMQQGKLDRAMEKLERALEQDPNRPDAHTAMALLSDRIGEVDKADYHYRRALRLSKESPEVMNAYGAFLCSRDRRAEGIKYLERAGENQLYATPEAAFTNAGVCARGEGKLDQAEAYLRSALARNPRFRDALLQMASISLERGVPLQSRAFVERVLQTSGPSPEALWLGFQAETELGESRSAARYAQRLKEEFPTSLQTRQLLERERDAG